MKKPLTNKKGEVRTLTKKDFKSMQPIHEVLPKKLLQTITKRKRGERGKQKAAKKISLSIRMNPAVVAHFKSTGAGWQIKLNNVLEAHVKKCGAKHRHSMSK